MNLKALDKAEKLGLSNRLGVAFQSFVEDLICKTVGGSTGIHEYLWIEPIVQRDGDVMNSGINCQNLAAIPGYVASLAGQDRWTPRPDYIISSQNPKGGSTWLIGDMTLSADALVKKYVEPGKQQGQWDAITNHADTYGLRIALFITFRKGSETTFRALSLKMGESSLEKGMLIYVLALSKGRD